MDNGSKSTHASTGSTKSIATSLHLECTNSVTSQMIEATGEILCFQPKTSHGCSTKEEHTMLEYGIETITNLIIIIHTTINKFKAVVVKDSSHILSKVLSCTKRTFTK